MEGIQYLATCLWLKLPIPLTRWWREHLNRYLSVLICVAMVNCSKSTLTKNPLEVVGYLQEIGVWKLSLQWLERSSTWDVAGVGFSIYHRNCEDQDEDDKQLCEKNVRVLHLHEALNVFFMIYNKLYLEFKIETSRFISVNISSPPKLQQDSRYNQRKDEQSTNWCYYWNNGTSVLLFARINASIQIWIFIHTSNILFNGANISHVNKEFEEYTYIQKPSIKRSY